MGSLTPKLKLNQITDIKYPPLSLADLWYSKTSFSFSSYLKTVCEMLALS
jgi:hypothetical protein